MHRGKTLFRAHHLHHVGSYKLGHSKRVKTSHWCSSSTKRVFDFSLAALLFVLLALPMMLIAVLVKLTSIGPVLFRQERLGTDGKRFKILKFRTMEYGRPHPGPALTTAADSRLTWIGGLLRKWKIDEFPQLLNVLRGQMSFVGPRPKVPHLELTGSGILSVRPGITGVATLAFRHEEGLLEGLSPQQIERFYVETIAPLKVQLDLGYIARATFFTDLRLVAQTLVSVFHPLQGIHFSTREQLPYEMQLLAKEKVWRGLAPTFES